MRRLISIVIGASLAVTAFSSLAAAGGPPCLAFYVDDVRYRTVGTPTDFSNTGAPASTFDAIYALGSGLVNVAESKPGDRDFNGGRWAVMPITWHVAPVQFTNAEQVTAAANAGHITIGTPIRWFFCSVNKVPPSWNN